MFLTGRESILCVKCLRYPKYSAYNSCLVPYLEKKLVPAAMDDASPKALPTEKSVPPEDWTGLLCCRGVETRTQLPTVMDYYGIGSIESFEPPRLQLCLAILLQRSFELFDPIISLTESKVLTSLGCTVLSINEQGRRRAVKPTLFFMPHCEAELYDNLLEANWEVDLLNRIVIFGNSLGAYEQHASLCKSSAVSSSRKHVLASRSFAEELEVNADSFKAFFMVRVGIFLALQLTQICK